MILARRGLLGGALALLAAPAIIRTPGLLMPVRPVLTAHRFLTREEWSERVWAQYQRSNSYRKWFEGIQWSPEQLAAIRILHPDGRPETVKLTRL